MRAMPYTPLTPCHCDKTDEPHYAEQGGLMRYVGDNAAYSKHLTDAECAAEYWRTIRDADVQGYSGKPVRPRGQCVIQEAFTWHRFAIHPHADEEEQ